MFRHRTTGRTAGSPTTSPEYGSHRRTLLKATSLAGLAAVSGCASLRDPATVSAQPETMMGNPIEAYTRSVNDAEIVTLLDGFFPLELGLFTNIGEEALAAVLRAHYQNPENPINLGISAHLVRIGGKNVLIDTGAGGQFGPTAGRMRSTLASIGADPDSIDEIILTHLHPDHIGGAIDGGEAAFPNAGLHVSNTEAEFWTSEQNRSQAPEQFKSMFDLARNVLDAYGDRVNRFSGEPELLAGVSAISMPGHTVGHMGYRIESGNEQLLIWGDMTAIAAVQFAEPEAGIAFDADSLQAAETRRRILDMVADDRLLIAGSHLPYPAYGHVERATDGYRYVAEEFQYG